MRDGKVKNADCGKRSEISIYFHTSMLSEQQCVVYSDLSCSLGR